MTRLPLITLVLAKGLSITGTRLSMIAIPWLVLTTTEDAVLTGMVAFAEMLPYVLSKAAGGPLIDRIGARRIAVAGDLASVLAIGCVPALHLLDMLSLWTLIPPVVVAGALRGPADAAKTALVPAVAEAAAVPLSRVTGIAGTIDRLASIAGAALAGGLVAAVGAAMALAVNAVCLLLSALVIAVGLRAAAHRPDAGTAATPYGAAMREGWSFLRRDAVLMGIVVMVSLTNLLDQAMTVVLMPSWARQSGQGVAVLGIVQMTFAGAAVVGALMAAWLAETLPRLTVYTVAFILIGFPRFALIAADPPLAVILSGLVVSGFACGFINPVLSAVMFERIPARLTGRVTSLISAATWGLMPFGGLVAGVLVETGGLRVALLILGAGYFAATMLPLAMPGFRDFARASDPVAPPVTGAAPSG